MSSVGCGSWGNILLSNSPAEGGSLCSGEYSRSSEMEDSLSVEKGVFRGIGGLFSKCLEMRDRRSRGGARFDFNTSR